MKTEYVFSRQDDDNPLVNIPYQIDSQPTDISVPSDYSRTAVRLGDARPQQVITFFMLGPIEFHNRQIRGTIQRTLLAALLSASSRSVSTEALVEELWGDSSPNNAENALQAHVSRLRRKLQASSGDNAPRLINCPSGYRLFVDEDAVDALVFLRALNDVRSGASSMRPAEAVNQLRTALSLWRGPVFGGPLGGSICQGAAARYEAARSVALEILYSLKLRSGRHSEIIPELSELVESSLSERFCEQLMIALYRSGRQTDALSAYNRMRTRLDTELGVEPSPNLRRHEFAILTHDPVLDSGTKWGCDISGIE